MTELPDFVALELELLQVPLSRIVCLLELSSWNEDQKTAFGTYIQNVYAGVERIFQYLLKERGKNIPKSSMWHYELLKTSFTCGLAPSEIQTVLENLMKFRHRHVHGYGHMLDESKLRELAAPISDTFVLFSGHLTDLRQI